MNYKAITLFASALLLAPVVSANELTNDFDLLCSIYREATELNLESTQLRSAKKYLAKNTRHQAGIFLFE